MIDLLLNLNYSREIRWVLALTMLYLGYYFFNIFINILITTGISLLVLSIVISLYVYHKIKISTPEGKEYILGYMMNLIKMGINRTIQPNDVFYICSYIWNV